MRSGLWRTTRRVGVERGAATATDASTVGGSASAYPATVTLQRQWLVTAVILPHLIAALDTAPYYPATSPRALGSPKHPSWSLATVMAVAGGSRFLV